MRQKVVQSLWALASVIAVGWCMIITWNDPLIGLIAFALFGGMHAMLGLALYARHYPVFDALVGLYITFTICSSLSIGGLLRPSAVLLLLAALLTIKLPADKPPLEQQRRDGV